MCVEFSLLLKHHSEARQAPRVQAQPSGHQILVEGVQCAVVLGDELDQSQPLHVDHLSSSQKVTDSFLQPVRLLLEAAVARQLLKQLEIQEEDKSETRLKEIWSRRQQRLRYFGPLVMNIHIAQQYMSRGVHSRLVSKHNSVS